MKTCRARSKPVRKGIPESHFKCTNDYGHEEAEHTACNGVGQVIARWKSETSAVELWGPGSVYVVVK